jgi:hypothetical protein
MSTIRHSFKFNQCNIPRTFIPRQLANTVLELITHYQQLDLRYKYASLFISFPYTHAEAQRQERCNFVCAPTYLTPPNISQLKFHVQSYSAPLVATAWNCSSECNGNNLESLSFLILWRMLTVCVQRLQLNVSLQQICWWAQTIVQYMHLSQTIKTNFLHNTSFYL